MGSKSRWNISSILRKPSSGRPPSRSAKYGAISGTPPCTVTLVDWADEEGARFGRSLFGSSAATTVIFLPLAFLGGPDRRRAE